METNIQQIIKELRNKAAIAREMEYPDFAKAFDTAADFVEQEFKEQVGA